MNPSAAKCICYAAFQRSKIRAAAAELHGPGIYISGAVEESILSLSASNMTFKAKPKEAQNITVTSNLDNWSISTSSSWIHVSKMGNQVFVAVDRNDTGDNRTGTVIVKAEAKSATLTVTQLKKKGLGAILGL